MLASPRIEMAARIFGRPFSCKDLAMSLKFRRAVTLLVLFGMLGAIVVSAFFGG